MKFSSLFTLNIQDFLKGFLIAVLAAVLTVVQNSLQTGTLNLDWSNIWHVALTAAVAYIAKNFFTPVPKSVVVDTTQTQVVTK